MYALQLIVFQHNPKLFLYYRVTCTTTLGNVTSPPSSAPTYSNVCEDGTHGCDTDSTVCLTLNEEGVEEPECRCLSGFKADPDSLSSCIATTTGAPTAFPTKRDMNLVEGGLAGSDAPSIAPTALPTLHPTAAVCADGSLPQGTDLC